MGAYKGFRLGKFVILDFLRTTKGMQFAPLPQYISGLFRKETVKKRKKEVKVTLTQ